MNPYAVVDQFELALADYCGAPYAVTTTSCTMAILLAASYKLHTAGDYVIAPIRGYPIDYPLRLPRRTYIGVPQSLLHAGWTLEWHDIEWVGEYVIEPVRIIDAARWLRADMYREGTLTCLSFHWSKHLAIGQGGAILTDSRHAAEWLREARFDGRSTAVSATECRPRMLGYHAYMMPRDAAEGLSRLALLPRANDPIPWDDYPDCEKALEEVF